MAQARIIKAEVSTLAAAALAVGLTPLPVSLGPDFQCFCLLS